MTSAHPFTIGHGILERRLAESVRAAGATHRVAVITDENVARQHGARVAGLLGVPAGDVLAVPAGERHKTRETWTRLTDDLLARGFGRDTTIVALGGGVVGDLAGFVAATYMRGVPVVQVPTTLLAMVDASIGGKTGVDTPAGKNLVGAFHLPAHVLIDPDLLATLPMEHLRAGFAEIVKHGVVADAAHFDAARDYALRWPDSSRSLADIHHLVSRSVAIKADIVGRDVRETALRKVLNFGHTIGHAVEAATDYATLHGYAVAIGMVAEARIAERVGAATAGTAESIEQVCRRAGLPTTLPDVDRDTLLGFTRGDKKVRAGRVEYALPKRIGEMAGAERGWAIPVDDRVVLEVLAA